MRKRKLRGFLFLYLTMGAKSVTIVKIKPYYGAEKRFYS